LKTQLQKAVNIHHLPPPDPSEEDPTVEVCPDPEPIPDPGDGEDGGDGGGGE
jgi:hypothetical protein